MKTALLIIDVQRALCSGDYEVFESRRVIDRINHVLQLARRSQAPVILIQHEEPGGPLEFGAEGWQLDPDLQALPTDIRIRKKTPDSFHHTELQATLQTLGVQQLVICGLQSDFCVDTTTRRALALGYPVTLVADGHSTVDRGALTAAQITAHHNVTLSKIDSFGPRAQAVPADRVRISV